MRTRWVAAAALSAAVAVGLAASVSRVDAYDHEDESFAKPSTDIADVFAWPSADGTKLNLVMTLLPDAGAEAVFDTQTQYVFHVWPGVGFGPPPIALLCQFAPNQRIACWLGDIDMADGDATVEEGLTSTFGDFRVFAGLRNDPTFWNRAGFDTVVDTVRTAIEAGALIPDPDGCYAVDAPSAAILATELETGGNDRAGQNVLAIVAEVDMNVIAGSENLISVWASTRVRP